MHIISIISPIFFLQVDTMTMWTYYINAMLEINSDLTTQAKLKRHLLNRAFRAANESNNMAEHHYLQYVELLYRNNPRDEFIPQVQFVYYPFFRHSSIHLKPNNNLILFFFVFFFFLVQVLERSTSKYNTSLKVWLQCLRFYIQQNNCKMVQEVFHSAKKHLGSEGHDIWHLYLLFLKTQQSPESNVEFEHLVNELACQPYATFNSFKASVLELLATTASIKRARKTYQLFIKNFPNCLEVHEMMADLESKQLKRDVKCERSCLEMLLLNFGKTRTDVWLRYMKFERSVGEPKNVAKLYDAALATLNPDLLEDFLTLHNLFVNGVV